MTVRVTSQGRIQPGRLEQPEACRVRAARLLTAAGAGRSPQPGGSPAARHTGTSVWKRCLPVGRSFEPRLAGGDAEIYY